MQDVAHRINTSQPVTKYGTVTASTQVTGVSSFDRTNRKTVPNETVAGTGLVNRFDDVQYYST